MTENAKYLGNFNFDSKTCESDSKQYNNEDVFQSLGCIDL